jgi:hypothetical protein
MSDTVNLIGVKADGSAELLGTIPTPPDMKRRALAQEQFGAFAEDGFGNDSDWCLCALDQYHEWLVAQGWKAPPLVVSPAV